MKNFLSFVAFFLALAVGAVHADDKSDVQAAVDAVIAANNANDMDREQALYSTEATAFNDRGAPLETELDWDSAREWIKSGGQWKVEYGKMDIAMHGTAAVVTGYRKGKVRAPDGFSGQGMGRFTWVLAKQEGGWKVVHRHYSRGVFVAVDSDE